MFACLGDIAYRDGSIYHAASEREPALIALTLVMTGILLPGLLCRQRRGPGGIGFEGWLVLLCYAAGLVLMNTQGLGVGEAGKPQPPQERLYAPYRNCLNLPAPAGARMQARRPSDRIFLVRRP